MTGHRCACCGGDLTVLSVTSDGQVTARCPNGGQTAHQTSPSVLATVRDLGAQLAAHRRHLGATPRDLPVARLTARGAIARCSDQILDLVAGHQSRHPAPPPPATGPDAATPETVA